MPTNLRLFFLMILILPFITPRAESSGFRSFPRRPNLSAQPVESSAQRLPTDSEHLQSWVFSELFQQLSSFEREALQTKAQQASQVFEKILFPQYMNLLDLDQEDWKSRFLFLWDRIPKESFHRAMIFSEDFRTHGKHIIVLDIDILNIQTVLIHELQHAFNYSFKVNVEEETWINEGLSQVVEWFITGAFPKRQVQSFLRLGSTASLLDWQGESSYANAFLFLYYLFQNYGKEDLLKTLIKSPSGGTDALMRAIHKYSPSKLSFQEVYANYSLALLLNSKRFKSGPYALAGSSFQPELQRQKMKSQFISSNEPLLPYQSRYTQVHPGRHCLSNELDMKYFLVHKLTTTGALEGTVSPLLFQESPWAVYQPRAGDCIDNSKAHLLELISIRLPQK